MPHVFILSYMISFKYLFVFLMLSLSSCYQEYDKSWKGQEPIQKVSTASIPINHQIRQVTDLGKGVFISNAFDGARLHHAVRTNDSLITLYIEPENLPINASAWYAFKIWSESTQVIQLCLTYPEGITHRYAPKWSRDGEKWENINCPMDKLNNALRMKIPISKDTLIISAHELITSAHVKHWMNQLDENIFVTQEHLGESQEGRAIEALRISECNDTNMLLIMARQHPPEITGYWAMQAFVESIASNSLLAKEFRKQFTTYVIPLSNPDGVDHGHWRHNAAGVDLNRDWKDFNQPETRAIRDFMKSKTQSPMHKFYFAVDFHSTWEDIYYTQDFSLKGNMPGLVEEMIAHTSKAIEEPQAKIKHNLDVDSKVTSTSYFFYEYGAESLTYEVGEKMSRSTSRNKGTIAAEKMMSTMLQKKSAKLTE